VVEASETFWFGLTVMVGISAVTGTNPETLTITDDGDQFGFTVADASAEEGSDVQFTVTLSQDTDVDLEITYDAFDGTAEVTDSDFIDTPGSVTFPAGSLANDTITFTIPTTEDTKVEPDETFSVTVSSAHSGFDGTTWTPQGTITNDDKYGIAVDDASADEGDDVTFTITLEAERSMPVDVTYSTSDGTALVADSDYSSASDIIVSFPAGPAGQTETFTVATTEDAKVEPAEDFTVTLSSADPNATWTDQTGTGMITNDDLYGITIADAANVNEGDTASFAVTVSNIDPAYGIIGTVEVTYSTGPGTAVSPQDYAAITNTKLSITAPDTGGTITVDTKDDTLVELEEVFYVNLTNPTANATIDDNQGQCTINIAEQAVLTIDTITVNESDGNARFTVTLDQPAEDDVTVQYDTADGTATTAGNDYTAAVALTTTITAGSKEGYIDIPVNNDALIELAENFSVTISNPTANATIGAPNQGQCTIEVDEQAVITVDDIVVDESVGNASFNVTLSAAAEDDLTFEYTTADGSATVAGLDYTGASGVIVTIAAGDTLGAFTVPVNDDTLVELAEDFYANLANPSPNGMILDNEARCEISIDDNDKTAISIDNVIVNESAGTADFTVTLNVAATDNVTVEYATADGTATIAGGDYTATSGTLTFVPGDTSETITVNITDDGLVEESENFFVDLTNPSGQATLAVAQGQCTINVDDLADLSIDDVTIAENGGSAVFTVTLSAESQFDVTVDYQTADNTAVAGGDYTATSGTLTIAAGSLSNTISVPILNTVDFPLEANETYNVNLTNPTVAGIIAISDNQGQGTITDNDHTLTIQKAGSADDGNCTISASAGTASGAGGGTSPPSPVTYTYDSLDTVTLTADDTLPAAGSVFKGWTGDVSSTSYSVNVAMDSDKTVTATFNAVYTLTINMSGTGLDRGAAVTAGGGGAGFPGGTRPPVPTFTRPEPLSPWQPQTPIRPIRAANSWHGLWTPVMRAAASATTIRPQL